MEDKEEFKETFLAAVEEFYAEWQECNDYATLPDFEFALNRVRLDGLVGSSI